MAAYAMLGDCCGKFREISDHDGSRIAAENPHWIAEIYQIEAEFRSFGQLTHGPAGTLGR